MKANYSNFARLTINARLKSVKMILTKVIPEEAILVLSFVVFFFVVDFFFFKNLD